MKKKYEKIIERDFKRGYSKKRFLLNILFMIVVFIYHETFSKLIFKYLVPNHFNTSLVSISLMLLISILLTKIGFKVLKDKYKASTNETNFLLLSLFVIYYFNYCCPEAKWLHVEINFLGLTFSYIGLLIFTLISILVMIFVRYLNGLGEVKKINSKNNILLDDSPISNQKKDQLDYQEPVKKLTEILKNDNHKKSFTIGLVGPWGNGKSSVLKMVKKELKKTDSKQDSNIIVFDFLPYLNHKENDIINEFFTSLSNELRPYNGKLSDLITEYSSKLTDLYENKNILGFIENQVSDFSKTPANELYKLINEMLVDINKKIVVLVDDLDRLNKDEILQVLKLIRNTADFRNTFFVIAMDKEYVVKSLKKSKKIFHSSFIDKFFQLEVYLPEIKTEKLKEYFTSMLTNQLNPNGPSDLSLRIKDAINDPDNLFEDYITNLRDVKRTVNQIVFDYPFTGGEINFKDFINFTYFKLKFPQFIKILKEGKNDFLDLDGNGFYQFKPKPVGETTSQANNVDILDMMRTVKLNRFIDLKKYQLYNDNFIKDCIGNDDVIDCIDRFLFIKSLAFLFGEENKVKGVDSIKYQNNFRMVMEQKIYADLLTTSEFNEILNAEKPVLITLLENLKGSSKIRQLLNRIEYYQSIDDKNIKQFITVLLLLFEHRDEFQLWDVNIINQIETLVNLHYKNIKPKRVFTSWLKENVFEGELISDNKKLIIYEKLWTFRFTNELWHLTEKYITDNVLKLFKKYINDNKSFIPAFDDYSFYGVYHSAKKVGELQDKIITIFKEFWTPEKNEILCTHFIEPDPFSKSLFKLSDMAQELFESKSNFVKLVKETSIESNEGLKELILFLELCEISKHNGYVVFDFKKSVPMQNKVTSILRNNKQNYDGLDKMSQIYFELNNKHIANKVLDNVELRNGFSLKISEYNNNWFIISTRNGKLNKEDVMTIAGEIYRTLIDPMELTKMEENKVFSYTNFIPQNTNNYTAKLLSVQPKIN